ncbi:MAG: undecaprenyl-phosphate glucose phosphotransferase [Clostridia bacterium]|nr:undecaprenyl-phosphate glucose phosphotransferase [Clostridia bacterium]
MIRKNQEFLNRLNQLGDILLVIGCYAFASWFWLVAKEGDATNMAMISGKSLLISLVYASAQSVLFMFLGFYSTTRTKRMSWKLGIIAFGTTATVLSSTFLLYLFRLHDFSRGVLFIFYGSTLTLLSLKYFLMEFMLRELRKRGYNIKHEVVIGTGKVAQYYSASVKSEQELGLNIIGFIGPRNIMRPLGGYEKLDQVLARLDVDEVIIALEPEEYGKIRDMIAACDKNGVKYYILPFYNDIIPEHPAIENVGGCKLINMRSNRLEIVGWGLLKRTFDIVVSLLGLVILSPLMAFVAIGVKLSSPGPILFKQMRIGYKRQSFTMLKFRSMRINDEENTAWSKKMDNRRTWFGSFIRRCSIDEFPQFINVLRGDMSLVGPRPELPFFVEQFKEKIPLYMVKHQVKPGITGWAQVNGLRGDTNIEERVKYDLWYIENWSVGLDLKIIFKTVFGGMMNKEAPIDRKHPRQSASEEHQEEKERSAAQ